MMRNVLIALLLLAACPRGLYAQVVPVAQDSLLLDYSDPKEFEIGGITVTGIEYLDVNVLKTLSGLSVGERIRVPGDEIADAIKKLWKQNLLSDIRIEFSRIEGDLIFLNLALTERPRLSKFSFDGVSKGEADKLRERLHLVAGKIINDNLLASTEYDVHAYFVDKGFLDATVNIEVQDDTTGGNTQTLLIRIDRKKRVRIHSVSLDGVTAFKPGKLKRALKDTKEKKWYKLFTSSKFIEDNFDTDKKRLIDKYNEKGYRDAVITFDTVYRYDAKTVNIDIRIDEGNQYYFRDVKWVGNTKYTAAQLTSWLGIKKGDVYNSKRLEEGLFASPSSRDVTSLYMDDGYLFFQVNPVEVRVENDSIDFEMRIYEGKQARINKVTVIGNTKTNDKVIMREIRTKPGQLFSRSDIIRTQRELAQLGYFDPEKLNVIPKPDPVKGTVDIEYVVEEKPSDQVELSGGWGAGQVVGTLGLSFNNFSARNLFRKGYWTPLPSGDGQRLSLRFVTNGKAYQSYNVSFTEPWLGGRKPNSLSLAYFHSVRNFSDVQSYTVDGVTVGLGKRLQWPDDFFSIYYTANYNYYTVTNYGGFIFTNGFANNFNLGLTFSRNSVSQPIYPRSGSNVSLSLQVTPPYSLFNDKDYVNTDAQERYKFIEYHKWKFKSTFFTPLEPARKLMLAAKAEYGFLGYYNSDIGQSPFERFYLGGDGLSGSFTLYGNDVIGMRGYGNGALSPGAGAIAYTKYALELRYPITLNPNATLYALGFLEAGNSWGRYRDFNPFNVKRAAGFGVRIFLPMFGMLGLDYGWPFDRSQDEPLNIEHGSPEFQFTLGQFF